MTTPPFADDAVQAYLSATNVVVLAMLTTSGAPLATPMWFVHDATTLAMVSVDGLAKVRHLQRDGRVSIVAEGGEHGAINGVVLSGEMRFLDGEERATWGRRFHQRYTPAIDNLWGGAELPDDRQVFCCNPRVASAFGI